MSQKKPAFGARPAPAKVIDPVAAEAFVAAGIEQPVPEPPPPPPPEPASKKEDKPKLKRLTIDLEPELHKQAKKTAVDRGESLADVIRRFLEGYAAR